MRSNLLAAAAGASTAAALFLRQSLRIPLSETIREPVLLASLPSVWIGLLFVSIGALAGLVVGRYLGRRGATDSLAPLLLPGLAAVAYVPGLLFIAPFFSVFAGPFLDLVLLGCLATAVWKFTTRAGWRWPATANRSAVAAFVVFLVLGLRLQDAVGLSGDEPHYLLITYSLLHDGDLAVENNYSAGDYRHFYNGRIGPHLAHGSSYSVHGIGLPLILFPGFALFGLRGVLVTQALLGALLVREVFLLVELLVDDRRAALLAAAGFGLTAPALFLIVSAYPETWVALAVVAAWRRMVSPPEPSARIALVWGLVFGLLPFLHMKFLPLAAVLGAAAVVVWRKRRLWVVAGIVLGMATLAAYFTQVVGNPNPLAAYGRQRIFLDRIPLGSAGLLFDQEFGLLPVSPFYLVGIMALGTLLRSRRSTAIVTLGVLAAVALPGAAHPLWTGGTSPPARFLFPALPLLAVAAAVLWARESRRGAVPWIRPLLIVSVCLGSFMALGPGQPLYLNQRDGSGRVWEALGSSWDLTHYLPSLVRADLRSILMAVIATVVLLAGIAFHWNRRHRWAFPSVVGLTFLYVVLTDGAFPGGPAAPMAARWMGRFLEELSRRGDERFVLLPRGASLSHAEALARVDIPIILSKTLEAGMWQSPSLYLPAGVYRLEGEDSEPLSICNGPGTVFTVVAPGAFSTRVAWAHFNVRAERPRLRVRLRCRDVRASPVVADRSLRLDSELVVHALDDEAYLEAKGFWVRAGARAEFALEAGRPGMAKLRLANGGVENWVEIEYVGRVSRFLLRSWEQRTIEVPVDEKTKILGVTSGSGFRPSDLDPDSGDRRMLGVFLSTARL